jgi:hypothetical protein
MSGYVGTPQVYALVDLGRYKVWRVVTSLDLVPWGAQNYVIQFNMEAETVGGMVP